MSHQQGGEWMHEQSFHSFTVDEKTNTDSAESDPSHSSIPPSISMDTPMSVQVDASSSPHDPSWFEPASLEAAAHAAIDAGDDSVVAQFLMLLEAHRARCERQQLYVEAALVADKVAQLRAHEDSRRAHSLAVRHLAERLDLEEAHILEFDEFGLAWEQKMKQFDAETLVRIQTLKARLTAELEQWTAQEQEQLLMRPKFSKQLLQLRSKQESLARARDYVGAERVRAQAAQLERVELDALKASWGVRVHQKRARFLESQAREESGFASRRAEERAQLEQRKRSELRSLVVQKYANLKGELERSHAKERSRLEKMAEMGISDSATIRQEAPRRANGILLPNLSPDQSAAWSAGLAAGAAMLGRNHSQQQHQLHSPTAQQQQQQQHSYPSQQRIGGSALLDGTNAPPPYNSAVSASPSIGTLVRGRTGQQQQQQQQRRSIEDEQEAMLREPTSLLTAASSSHTSSAAEVPTISSALFGRNSSQPHSFGHPAPIAPAASVYTHSHGSLPLTSRSTPANSSVTSTHTYYAPSSSQLIQQKNAAHQQQIQIQQQQTHQQKPLIGVLSGRSASSPSYDPLGSARIHRTKVGPSIQPLSTRIAYPSSKALAGLPSIPQRTNDPSAYTTNGPLSHRLPARTSAFTGPKST
jgi:hypothetical protein